MQDSEDTCPSPPPDLLTEGTADLRLAVERPGGRHRLIRAALWVPRPAEAIWQVLSDYETLPEFIPNLAISRRLPHPEGGIRLEQVGLQPVLKVNFRARVVLDLIESCPERIEFKLVEGDFQVFAGFWALEPQGEGTDLIYQVQVCPKVTLPVSLVERRLTRDLHTNLTALRQRVLEVCPEVPVP